MFGTALRIGLRTWARAPFAAGIGTAVAVGLFLFAYAVAVQVSTSPWLTFVLWAVFGNLSLAGWAAFCATLTDGAPRWTSLLVGFRKPIAISIAGLSAIGIVLILLLLVHYLSSHIFAMNWIETVGFCLILGLLSPAGIMIVFGATSDMNLTRAIGTGMAAARRHWPSFFFLVVLTFGLTAAGAIPGLLLERHALDEIGGLLPLQFAEYGLAIVRLIALLGGLAGVSVAGCIWAAAWHAADAAP